LATYYIYAALSEDASYFGFTHHPHLDGAWLAGYGYHLLYVVALPLPIDWAVAIAAASREYHLSQDHGKGKEPWFSWLWPWKNKPLWPMGREERRRLPRGIKRWMQFAAKQLHLRGLTRRRQVPLITINLAQLSWQPMAKDLAEPVEKLIWGRMLSYDEIQAALGRKGQSGPYPLRDVLQYLALEGSIAIQPGIESPFPGYHICRRCGEREQLDKIDCPLCGRSDCMICPSCRSLGEVRSCRELYQGRGRTLEVKGETFSVVRPQFSFELTLAQKGASKELQAYTKAWLKWYVDGSPLDSTDTELDKEWECLVWAVCGAGKTEIAFQALALALARGLRIVFAIPRRDVVVELAERARAAFPQVPVTPLYGGVGIPESIGPLVVATTHQLLRFDGFFDLAILDEADAFPYVGSAMLYRAFRRSIRPGGLKIYMTATPEPKMLHAARRGSPKLITIPVRHHGYPVPVPELLIDKGHRVPHSPRGLQGKAAILSCDLHFHREFLSRLKKSVAMGNRIFVFVPRIWLVGALVEVISGDFEASDTGHRGDLSNVPILGTHSEDRQRDEKRKAFQAAAPAVMVTTSVLERGITVPRADVIVLYAHDRLYDARTLIQMAGRSGRSSSYPQGQVWFMAAEATSSIRWAIKNLEDINATARRQGLLGRADS